MTKFLRYDNLAKLKLHIINIADPPMVFTHVKPVNSSTNHGECQDINSVLFDVTVSIYQSLWIPTVLEYMYMW